MEKFWKAALAVGGVAAIGAFVFWSLYKQWLSLPIFSQLNSGQTFAIMVLFLVLTFLSLVGFLFAYMRGGKGASSGPSAQQAFDLHESWKGVNEIDCARLVGPDVVRASRAMSITATSWLNGLVDKKIIVNNHFDDYQNLYLALSSCDKTVPGFERSGKKCIDFITPEIKTAYEEMRRHQSGG